LPGGRAGRIQALRAHPAACDSGHPVSGSGGGSAPKAYAGRPRQRGRGPAGARAQLNGSADPAAQIEGDQWQSDISIERAYAEMMAARGAAASRVEALMYALSIRNTAALDEFKIRYWLSSLSEDQLVEVCERLLQLDPEVMRRRNPNARPWSEGEVKQLVKAVRLNPTP